MVADALLVYRLYLVWNCYVKIIIGPVLLLLGYYRFVMLFLPKPSTNQALSMWISNTEQGENTYAADIYTWGIALFALSLLLNLIVTGLIAGRLWWCGKRMAATVGRRHSRKHSPAMAI
ncbi:hypothetical protein MPER_01582, partial [Moniliophthora perniciosa FA553]